MTEDLCWRLCECNDSECDCKVSRDCEMGDEDEARLVFWYATWWRTDLERGVA